ncbi:MAG: sugar phosphate isomerase/epimerase family protein [Eubacteriales bacterium]|jgi:sugar phosphate isomerase/epimerase
MKLSINAAHFCDRADGRKRPLEEVLKRCADAGFSNVDLLVPENQAEQTAKILEKYALTVNQSHCPFNRYEKKDYALFAEDILSAVRSAHLLGSKILVVHGDEFDFSAEAYSEKAVLEFNYRLFSPAAELLDRFGMKLAFENVFPDMNVPRYCSTPEELLTLVGKFPKETVGICLDTGHAKVADDKHYLENIRSYADRVIATHMHDNYYGKDLHLFPFLGELDLAACVNILKDAGYAGEFTYEFVYDRIPDEFLPEVLHLLYRMGKFLTV